MLRLHAYFETPQYSPVAASARNPKAVWRADGVCRSPRPCEGPTTKRLSLAWLCLPNSKGLSQVRETRRLYGEL